MKTSKQYAEKIVEVACHKLMADKEIVTKIVEALINEHVKQSIENVVTIYYEKVNECVRKDIQLPSLQQIALDYYKTNLK
jgi:ferredoxin-thioredoxin reductase catalytic subunit